MITFDMADKAMKISWDSGGPELKHVVESLTYREVRARPRVKSW